MARLFCIPGVALLFSAFVLNFIVSISLPYLPALDITRTHFDEGAFEEGKNAMTELRFGIWTPCYYNHDDDRTCAKLGYAYSLNATDSGHSNSVVISSPWTRGLAVHPVATAVSLFATALALSEHVTVALIATLTAWLASLITLIAFIIDIALFAWTKHQFKKLNVEAHTKTGPGFWLTFIAFILLSIGGASTCLGRIRNKRAQRSAAPAVVETANVKATHTHERSASTPPPANAADEEAAHTTSNGTDEKADHSDHVQPAPAAAKSGWASKFKFGKKSSDA